MDMYFLGAFLGIFLFSTIFFGIPSWVSKRRLEKADAVATKNKIILGHLAFDVANYVGPRYGSIYDALEDLNPSDPEIHRYGRTRELILQSYDWAPLEDIDEAQLVKQWDSVLESSPLFRRAVVCAKRALAIKEAKYNKEAKNIE